MRDEGIVREERKQSIAAVKRSAGTGSAMTDASAVKARRLVLQNNVQRVNDSGNITEDGQEDVDEEVCAATTLEEYTSGRKDDGEDDLDDVGCSERHFGGSLGREVLVV